MDCMNLAESGNKWWVLASQEGFCSLELVLVRCKWLLKCKNVIARCVLGKALYLNRFCSNQRATEVDSMAEEPFIHS
jgi:hypothetical protein